MAGYPVALTLAGVSLIFAVLGHQLGVMGFGFSARLPQRIFGVMTNDVLLALPLFIFMGVMLEQSRIAEDLLERMGRLFGALRGGLGFPWSRRRVAGGLDRHCRRDRRDHGPDHAAGHAAAWLRPAARRRHGGGLRDAGADHPAVDRSGRARRPAQQRLSGGAAAQGNFAPSVCR